MGHSSLKLLIQAIDHNSCPHNCLPASSQVDAVLSGHVHSYYRSCSVFRETCADDNSGIVHLVIGTGGHVLSDVEDQQRLWCR